MFHFHFFPFLLIYSPTTISLLKLMYFSSSFGIHLIFPFVFPRFFTKRCASYPERLWKITGVNFGFFELEITFVMSRPTTFSSKMTMIPYFFSVSPNSFWQIQQMFAFSKSYCSFSVKGTIFFEKSNFLKIVLISLSSISTNFWGTSSPR